MNFLNEIGKSFSLIESYFNEKTLKEFVTCEYYDLYLYHYSLGVWIRNNLLNKGNLLILFQSSGIEQKDDMSSIIIKLFYLHIKTKKQYWNS